ncbi:ADP-glyceromanno-heptose 6-epimerase [Paludisphaera borealis]|uniref:ADP-L-glycero-D-manno-heptose-6-epimerase n=1 Tax=Paludisphaera borealis TaxID=1387353 RepID=A0A1U7CV83_9BACT|nr:ADP-glyceromanno-heptose 6-epimerase [Paludisphaera borealis]APW62842.1 ADP-L-glycero-D-manno-heptose-6-epimerase [Paludisphaera borealis]
MIAITGAAGFIGSNLAHRLSRLGHDLLLVDDPPTAAKAVNWAGLGRFQFIPLDQFLGDLPDLDRSVEAVFHLGACSSTTETDWSYLLRNNVEYTRRLWEWCAEVGLPFYYASSAATYGDGSQGFSDHTPPTELRPLNLYGKSKNDFDVWALAEVAKGAPEPAGWAGLKFFNVYGPRERHKGKMASVVWHARRQILETGEVRLFRSNDPTYPDGGQRRDFVFVEDCIDHMLWLWEHPDTTGVYNSGTGVARTFQDLVLAVFAALEREPRIQFIDMPAELGKQYQNYTQAEMSKLRDAGCSKPATTLEEGVRRTLSPENTVSETQNAL